MQKISVIFIYTKTRQKRKQTIMELVYILGSAQLPAAGRTLEGEESDLGEGTLREALPPRNDSFMDASAKPWKGDTYKITNCYFN